VRGDVDLDGDVDATDSSTISTSYYGIVMGRGGLSDEGVGNRRKYAGYRADFAGASIYESRHRDLASAIGMWASRDPVGYVDSLSLYQYVANHPLSASDPLGQCTLTSVHTGLLGLWKYYCKWSIADECCDDKCEITDFQCEATRLGGLHINNVFVLEFPIITSSAFMDLSEVECEKRAYYEPGYPYVMAWAKLKVHVAVFQGAFVPGIIAEWTDEKVCYARLCSGGTEAGHGFQRE
jgi:RHS repeat-associated protein